MQLTTRHRHPSLPVAGSVKEGASRDPKYDYGEEEELHVLITGDRQEDVRAVRSCPLDALHHLRLKRLD